MKKVALLTAENSRNAGGLFNSVKGLAFGLMPLVDISIISYDDKYSKEDRVTYKNIPLTIYKTISWLPTGLSFDLLTKLNKSKPLIVHQQGIWMYFSFIANLYRDKSNSKLIIAPRGMLDPWALKNSNWKKRIVGYLYEHKNLREADCIHALCYSEYLSIREFGLKNPVAIIPNGTNLPEKEVKRSFGKKKKSILFLGRIHPKKGIGHLMDAIKIIKDVNTDILNNWNFKIGGWSQVGHESELQLKCKELEIEDYVEFIGPQFASDKDLLLREVDAFILPSYSEGLPMSILEAWAYKLPVLMTEECNIPSGFEKNAAIKINRNSQKLANELIDFMTTNQSGLEKLSQNGFDLVNESFTWESIAIQTNNLYEWLLGNEEKPEFVYLD